LSRDEDKLVINYFGKRALEYAIECIITTGRE